MSLRSGGGNYVAFYTTNSGHTAVHTTAVFTGNLLETTSSTKAEDGTWTFEFTQLQDNADFYSFIETYAAEAAEGTIAAVTLEDGTTVGGSTANSIDLVMIKAGAVDSSNKRKGIAAIVKLASTSGTFSETNGEYSKPTLTAISQKSKALLTVSTILPTSLYSTAAVAAIPLNSKGKIFFADKAS